MKKILKLTLSISKFRTALKYVGRIVKNVYRPQSEVKFATQIEISGIDVIKLNQGVLLCSSKLNRID